MRNSSIEVHPIAGALGAEIGGVDVAADLDAAVIGEIRQALLDFGVIFFRDQTLDRDRHKAFTRRFGEIFIPTEAVQETRAGGKTVVKNKTSLPGYVFVEIEMSEEVWHLVKDTPKVTGFIGNQTPTPVKDSEIDGMRKGIGEMTMKPKPKVSFEQGDEVRVIEGPFTSYTGLVEEVKPDKQKLKVMVSIFGRPTPVELDFAQVEKRTA